jgi:DNA mismatch repair ATPase MutS
METPAEMQERVKGEKKNSVKADRVISREITQVLTKGTYNRPPVAAVAEDGGPPNKSQGGYTPIYLISVQSCHPAYAFSLLDTANNRILIGVSKNLEEFKTMLYRTRPVELLYDPANLSFEDKKLMT